MADDSRVGVSNPWESLNGGGASTRGGKRGGRGGGRGGGMGRGGPSKAQTSGSDAIAAFKGVTSITPQGGAGADGVDEIAGAASVEWTTQMNRSNTAKSRRDPAQVRTIPVDEAIAELEAKSVSVHRGNSQGRTALWGQWCRRMEDNRLDADCKYVDKDGVAVPFDEVFIRSRALEEAVASVVRAPVSDDAELTFLFSHCLEGDAVFHRRLADGLKVVGECFRECGRPVDTNFVDQLVVILAALKVNPRHKRDAGAHAQRLEQEISFNIAKAQELSRGDVPTAPEARHQCTSELVRLGAEKLRIVAGPLAEEVEETKLRVLFEQLSQVIKELLGEATNHHTSIGKQYDAFQNKIKTAMMGDDAEYMRVLQIDQDLDKEMRRLADKKRDLQRQLEEVTVDFGAAEARKRQHTQSSAKVINLYTQRMKAFTGEDGKMTTTFKTAQGALDRSTRAHEFLSGLCDVTLLKISNRKEKTSRARKDGSRQVLAFLSGHADAVKESLEMVERRFKFCASKLDSMRAELQEARDIGMPDLAADLASAVAKFMEMQKQAHKGVEGGDSEVARIDAILAQVLISVDESDEDAARIRGEVETRLAEIKLMRSSLDEVKGANGAAKAGKKSVQE